MFLPLILLHHLSDILSIEEPSPALEKFRDQVRKIKTRENDAPLLKTLVLGLPSKKHPISTAAALAINIICTLLTLDFVFRALVFFPSNDLAFSRVGYVSPTTANVLVREPDLTQLPLMISYQEFDTAKTDHWVKEGTIYMLDDSTDFTYPVTLTNLKPATKYRYAFSNNKTGTFITAPKPGTQLSNRLTFLTSSCIKPNFPYNVFSHPLRIPGIEQMSRIVSQLPSLFRPSFMLFLGDFIYIDVPLRFGFSAAHYRSEYRRVYSSPSWYENNDGAPAIDTPWIHTLDDHEIANDWSKGNTTPPYPAAADPYSIYHVSVNPPIPDEPYATPENTTYFSFVHGPASFFVLDTRTYRSEPLKPNSTMLGSAQRQSLISFLRRPENPEVKWKIIASSVPFTKNWRVGTPDTWGGFLNERSILLEEMWHTERDQGIRVVLLSGDRHEFGATRFPDPSQEANSTSASHYHPLLGHHISEQTNGGGRGIHEFSVGPLNMFYLPIRSYRQTDDQDIMIKYAPDGNVKFGMIDIDLYDYLDHDPNPDNPDDDTVVAVEANLPYGTSPAAVSALTYSLYVDVKLVWKYRLTVPVAPPSLVDSPKAKGKGKVAPSSPTRASSRGLNYRHSPGRVLFDIDEGKGTSFSNSLKEGVGRFEEGVRFVIDEFRDRLVLPVLEQARKRERVD